MAEGEKTEEKQLDSFDRYDETMERIAKQRLSIKEQEKRQKDQEAKGEEPEEIEEEEEEPEIPEGYPEARWQEKYGAAEKESSPEKTQSS